MAEFQWWLLLVGLVAGGGLVALVLMDGARRDDDVDAEEVPAEATWIADRLGGVGGPDPDEVEEILRLHRAYLSAPPPDSLGEPPIDTPEEASNAISAEDATSTPEPVVRT